jgi:hypothetical protein
MPKRTLNDRTLKALKPAPKGETYDVMDAVVPGFGVRVSAARCTRASSRSLAPIPIR